MEPALGGKDDTGTDEVPDELVQEQRMEEGVGGEPGWERGVGRADLQPPGKGGGGAEQFFGEVAADPPDALGDQQRRRERVGER